MSNPKSNNRNTKYVVLAGGGGGARLVDGLARVVSAENLTIIGNTGDDFVHMGLTVCPDMDTLLYTLAGAVNPDTGWGRADESWRVIDTVRQLGGPGWFNIGDLDLATHLTRSHLLAQGQSLTDVTAHLSRQFGVQPRLLPMCDALVPTLIETPAGIMPFQEWFVKERWQPEAKRIILPDTARATAQAIEAVRRADVVIIAPSNPYVSIDPILNAYPLGEMIADLPDVVIAVTPIIGGDAVKGPTAKMMREWDIEVSPVSIVEHYAGLINGFVYDEKDAGSVPDSADLTTLTTDTWMRDTAGRQRLAQTVVEFAEMLL